MTKETTINEVNKLKISKADRALVESFMGYADGYLSEWITWNDVMPVVEKIASVIIDEKKQRLIQSIQMIEMQTLGIMSRIEDVCERAIQFIKWYQTKDHEQK
jgi:hypothetical protein